jgi:hypothetical protein
MQPQAHHSQTYAIPDLPNHSSHSCLIISHSNSFFPSLLKKKDAEAHYGVSDMKTKELDKKRLHTSFCTSR